MRRIILICVCCIASSTSQIANNTNSGCIIKGQYSACGNYSREINGNVLWYNNSRVWIPYGAGNCSKTALPESLYGVNCDLRCPPGYRQKEKSLTTACEICKEGSFSLGGGLRIYHFEDMSEELDHSEVKMDTYCSYSWLKEDWIEGEEECSGWIGHTTYMDSGIFPAMTNSILEFQFSIRNPAGGELIVTYSSLTDSDAPDYDRLYLQIATTSGEVVYEKSLQNTVEDATVNWKLAKDDYIVKFVHTKYDSVFGDEEVISKANIRFLKILGLDTFQEYCILCKPGYYQTYAGAADCNACLVNTHQELVGQPTCSPCQKTEFAPEGSPFCFTKPRTCDRDDMNYDYSPCIFDVETNQYYRKKIYGWILPRQCLLGNMTLPEDEITGCADCTAGFISVNNDCYQCPPGYAAYTHCQLCDSGAMAIPVLVFDDWTNWDHLANKDNRPHHSWRRSCISYSDDAACLVNRWNVDSDENFLEAEHMRGTSFDLSLELKVDTFNYEYITISFTYQIIDPTAGVFLDFFVDGQQYLLSKYAENNEDKRGIKIPIVRDKKFPPNILRTHVLTWTARKRDVGPIEAPAHFIIHNIRIVGALDGSASSCTPCSPGYYQPDAGKSGCIPCPPGTYQNQYSGTNCIPCSGGEVTVAEASVNPTNCPLFSFADATHTACDPTCYFESSTHGAYNITGLQSPLYFEQYVGDQLVSTYLSFCSRLPNELCPDESAYASSPFVCYQYHNLDTASDIFINGGSAVHYLEPPTNSEASFVLAYTDGSTKGCETGLWKTTITFYCSMEATPFIFFNASMSSPCDYHFEITSQYGCRNCRSNDWMRTQSECINGMHTIDWLLINGTQCNFLSNPHHPYIQQCGTIIEKPNEEPTNWFSTKVLVLIACVLIGSAIFVGIAGFFWERERSKREEHEQALMKYKNHRYGTV